MRGLFFVLLALCLVGCSVADPHQLECGHVYTFWDGWWHGTIMPVTWIWSLLSPDVAIYEACNNGGWYDIGFLVGIGFLASSFGSSVRRRKRRSS